VTLTKGFWLGQHAVTQAEWQRMMQTMPWGGEWLGGTISKRGDAIDVFDEYCVKRRDKIKPPRMIRYQLEVVKRIPVEQAAQECGIGDLDKLMNAQRAFTARDIEVLSDHFQIDAERFTN
jgi:hypothetical protein